MKYPVQYKSKLVRREFEVTSMQSKRGDIIFCVEWYQGDDVRRSACFKNFSSVIDFLDVNFQ